MAYLNLKKFELHKYTLFLVSTETDYACKGCVFYDGEETCHIIDYSGSLRPRSVLYKEIGCIKGNRQWIFKRSLKKILEKL